MNDLAANSSSKPKSQMPAIASVEFCSVDEMKEASESAGWTVGYEQIESGQMIARTRLAEYSDLSLMDEFASRRMELHGEPPAGHMTILAPCVGSELRANGEIVGDQQVYVVPGSKELLCHTSDDCQVLSAHLPASLIESIAHDRRARSHHPGWENARSIEFGASASKILRRLMRLCLYEPVQSGWQQERTSQILDLLSSAISGSDDKADKIYCKDAHNSAFQTVSRARGYIEAHLNQPLSMPQLAAYSAVSLSKLERSFKKELGLTPTQYVLARRLHAARRELQQISYAEGQVAIVATNYGFNHLGRFAGTYKRLFGELPSETLST